jgi:hypothetical protein
MEFKDMKIARKVLVAVGLMASLMLVVGCSNAQEASDANQKLPEGGAVAPNQPVGGPAGNKAEGNATAPTASETTEVQIK